MHSLLIHMAAADYLFRRKIDISSGNCKLHKLDEAETAWRQYKPFTQDQN